MPKLSKVQKKVARKKRDTSTLHENSRDAMKLRRAAGRAEKLEKLAGARNKAKNPHLQRVSFFKGAARAAEGGEVDVGRMQGLVTRYTEHLHITMNSILTLGGESYIGRGNDELAELKAQRRPGRPASAREDMLKQRMAQEDDEYSAGYWVPDMRDEKNLERLREWNGEWASLGNIKFIRLSRAGMVMQSSFPPKGQS